MRKEGEITVFLAMLLICICSLLCAMAESVRTAGARWYLRMAVDSSMDSLMSQYHRALWEQYRLLGLEYSEPKMLETEFLEFMQPYEKAENWYPMKGKQAEITDTATFTQGDGRYFEQEILDYMKYGLIGIVWDELNEEGAGEMLASLKEAGGINQISNLYEGHTKEAVRLEKALEKLHGELEEQKKSWNGGRECLDRLDGHGFISQAKQMIKSLKKVPSLVEAYERQADKLNRQLQESRKQFENQPDLSQQTQAALEAEISQYEEYTAADGRRRSQITAMKSLSVSNTAYIQETIDQAEAVIDYIDSWEPEDEDDELDEEALWSPVCSRFDSCSLLELGIEFGVKDKETQGWLENIKDMAEKGMLSLVLPQGTVLSGQKLPLGQPPSGTMGKIADAGGGLEESRWSGGVKTLVERLLVGEYGVRYFKPFQKEMDKNTFYELEYILHGDENDRENLENVAARLVLLRQGLNLMYILGNSVKRQEARTLALAIVGGSGMLPLVAIVSFFIMAVWALGEALMDVRCLLGGGAVPFIKAEGDWRLSLEGLVKAGADGRLPESADAGDDGKGMNYKAYLRLLLFKNHGSVLSGRMMDVIQMNIRQKQPDFLLGQCACTVDMEVSAGGKHVFFSPGLWKSKEGFTYDTRMEVSGSYLEKP